ncbi:hypothetical protein Q3G72_028596 [Acer saccharum]|nr:hypothetical protein Q3G72_028596 [Acer saccharum]
MEDNLAAIGAEANPPSRFSIVLCRQVLQKGDRFTLQTHLGIGQERDLTALYLEPIHDCIAECLACRSATLKKIFSSPRGPVRMARQGSWAGSGPVHGGHGADQVRHEGGPRNVLKGASPPDRPATARGSTGS